MVVDPNEGDYRQLLMHAESLGVHFRFTHTGAEALACRTLDKIAAWLINIQLPDMTGLELYHFLSQRQTQAPVLIVDNQYAEDREVTVLATGRLHYLCKPVNAYWIESIVPTSAARSP
jgi:DNA-binding response OmpR family regulator